ncbi:hypothetical protein POKO110462_02210 [Pontibacter korlensis]|uniref:Uncharacterized protein n=1 Tax=Pontibacter korlensis TaxID=400092 RepID=A0A0E3ZED3_9BACT|nr:hypothetical protein [Pontibacter korlensis]AKD03709.1 hypothetical protein PKOR_11955 [Pontibacter korlensis]
MEENNTTFSDYATCLTQFLGRKPSTTELICFEGNQNLLLINRRAPENNAYCISFVNDTAVQLMTDSMLLGGSMQLHSQEGAHRFYSVMFEAQGTAEEHYLMLDASTESVVVCGVRTMLVQSVRLITIEELVRLYDPVMYNLT